MAEATPTKTEKTGPKRSVSDIQRDLSKARARYQEIHPQIELDNKRLHGRNEQIKKKLAAWEKEHPGEEFDEVTAGFSIAPHEVSIKLQEEFHGLHYELARLEDELNVAVRDRAKA